MVLFLLLFAGALIELVHDAVDSLFPRGPLR